MSVTTIIQTICNIAVSANYSCLVFLRRNFWNNPIIFYFRIHTFVLKTSLIAIEISIVGIAREGPAVTIMNGIRVCPEILCATNVCIWIIVFKGIFILVHYIVVPILWIELLCLNSLNWCFHQPWLRHNPFFFFFFLDPSKYSPWIYISVFICISLLIILLS